MDGYFAYCKPPMSRKDAIMLGRVLEDFCDEQHLPLTSFEASDAASALLELFRHGIHSERRLAVILNPRPHI